jgi:Peptidase family M41
MSVSRTQNASEATVQKIDTEIRRFVEEGYNEATRILTERRADLEALAKGLLEFETERRSTSWPARSRTASRCWSRRSAHLRPARHARIPIRMRDWSRSRRREAFSSLGPIIMRREDALQIEEHPLNASGSNPAIEVVCVTRSNSALRYTRAA